MGRKEEEGLAYVFGGGDEVVDVALLPAGRDVCVIVELRTVARQWSSDCPFVGW